MTTAVQQSGGLQLPVGFRAVCADEMPVASISRIAASQTPPELGEPLVRSLGSAPAYPVAALGAVLAPAAAAIVERTQCAPATAANAVLAAAALAAQAHRDVRLPHGQVTPISLYIATICESGERKTSADQLALAPVRETEADMRRAFQKAWPAFSNHRDAYNAQRAQITGRKGDLASRRNALDELGDEPKPPLAPYLMVPEPTIEGLMKAWTDAPGALGLFFDEGGLFLGGYSMSKDHRLKTVTQLSRLWDGSTSGRLRAGDGASVLNGRRLSCHLMLQPGIAQSLYGDEAMWDQGMMARFLPAAPPSLAGTRRFKQPDSLSSAALDRYEGALLALLNKEPNTSDGRNELDPAVMDFSAGARRLWIGFHDDVDAACAGNGAYSDIRSLASKAPNHAARIAAVLTLAEHPDAMEIGEQVMANALTLCRYYLGEALRLRQSSLVDERMAKAETLRLWLAAWPEQFISASDIARSGPNAIRDVETVRDLMSILQTHGVVTPAGAQTVDGRKRRETWRIIHQAAAVNDR